MTPPTRANEPGSPTDRSKPIRVVGIDLGTTNSTIAEVRWEAGGAAPKVRCVEVEQATLEGTYTHVLFPSVVAIHEGRVWVGEGAKRLRSRTSSGAMSYFARCTRSERKRVGKAGKCASFPVIIVGEGYQRWAKSLSRWLPILPRLLACFWFGFRSGLRNVKQLQSLKTLLPESSER